MKSWTVELDNEWDVLGPFPIHAREQHYLSPAFPVNLSERIDFHSRWPSSYADGGTVGWSKATMAHDGSLEISFPNIRWATLRATEGWAALQHHAILRTTLTVYPPTSTSAPPRLLVDLKQGSYFTIRPRDTDIFTFVPEWCTGNIYDMERAVPHALVLSPDVSFTEPTVFDLFVSGDYEVRLFGDPLVRQSQIPVQLLSINVSVMSDNPSIQRQPSQDVVCDFVSGYAFGDCIGVAVQSVSGSWTVNEVKAQSKRRGLHLDLLQQIKIATTQTRIVPILIVQDELSYFEDFILLDIILESVNTFISLSVSLPIRHHSTLEQHTSIRCTYLYTNSMPTSFLAIPPKSLNDTGSGYPMLALHGAGVDIFVHVFWARSLPDNKCGWTVIPTGRTSWGLDWHGPSAKDAWSSLDALRSILIKSRSAERYRIPPDCKVIVIGHSNGGQGTWYLASRFPDRILAAIPAAAYIKSQSYIPLTLSRSAHFIDPSLRSILESSFTPDDNDLHLSNLIDIPILAIHGGEDENVPVWHTRETVALLESLCPTKEVLFKEDSRKGHWYPDVLKNQTTDSFLDKVTSNEASNPELTPEFTLTVTMPHESGSLRGWRINRLRIPGRVGRLNVRRASDSYIVQTSNIQAFSVPLEANPFSLVLNEQEFHFSHHKEPVGFNCDNTGTWTVISPAITTEAPLGRLQAILSSEGPITIVISGLQERRELSLALRIAHILHIYHQLDSVIITETDALAKSRSASWDSGNIVIIGRPSSTFVTFLLRQREGPVRVVDSVVYMLHRKFNMPGQGIIFTYPHPSCKQSLVLFLLYCDFSGLERAARLFPFRTGVATPDWVVLGERSDLFGAAGVDAAGVWTNDWKINESMTWFYR